MPCNVRICPICSLLSVSPHNNAWAKVKIFVDDGAKFRGSLCSSAIGVKVDWHWLRFTNYIGNLAETIGGLPALYWIMSHIKEGSNQMCWLFLSLLYGLLDHPSTRWKGRSHSNVYFTRIIIYTAIKNVYIKHATDVWLSKPSVNNGNTWIRTLLHSPAATRLLAIQRAA